MEQVTICPIPEFDRAIATAAREGFAVRRETDAENGAVMAWEGFWCGASLVVQQGSRSQDHYSKTANPIHGCPCRDARTSRSSGETVKTVDLTFLRLTHPAKAGRQ